MSPRILLYLVRRDLRLADNPILHEVSKLSSQSHVPFTHFLPLYVFPAHQVEVSGFLRPDERSPYPEARSEVGKFWRCGHHRVKFLAESVWDLKKSLENVGSGLEIRVGMLQDVVRQVLDGFKESGAEVTGLWMTAEPGVEEKREERAVKKELERDDKPFKLWPDEKHFVDDRDIPFQKPSELPDVFTSFKKMVEPLRDAPRKQLAAPSSLPPLPPSIPEQAKPFTIPSDFNNLVSTLHKPLSASLDLRNPPQFPSSSAPETAIPFKGGEATVHDRIKHLLASGAMTHYKDTRNGLLGADFSSKLSAWLALGCVTARQIHHYMLDFEEARTTLGKGTQGYGNGENKGTAGMRFELLWRDYFRLCSMKFGPRLFHASGFRGDESIKWKYDNEALQRFLDGTTGIGLVDASQRELFLTGYTSNRTRQNVASMLAKYLQLDWRLGAEWYECCLVDYDVCSNWGNWQYNAGVGNDPRDGGLGRRFNMVKQSSDYDSKSEYITGWCEELRPLQAEEAWQVSKVSEDRLKQFGLQGRAEVQEPLVRIEWSKRGGRGGKGRGGSGGGGYNGPGRGGDRGGRGQGRGRGKDRGSGRRGFSKREGD